MVPYQPKLCEFDKLQTNNNNKKKAKKPKDYDQYVRSGSFNIFNEFHNSIKYAERFFDK